jgi:hypothetical protein
MRKDAVMAKECTLHPLEICMLEDTRYETYLLAMEIVLEIINDEIVLEIPSHHCSSIGSCRCCYSGAMESPIQSTIKAFDIFTRSHN